MKFRIGVLALMSAFALLAPPFVMAQDNAAGSLERAALADRAIDQSSAPPPSVPGNLPNNYVIGPEDVLTVVFWQDTDLSRDVVVRPDGHISLPLLSDVQAAGLTPEQLRDKIATEAFRYVEDATVAVIVKEVRSPKVFIIGEVMRPGLYPLNAPLTVLQLIATAGGLQEYAASEQINVVRTEGGRTTFLPFNYKEMMKQKNVQQNITLKSGDTVVVP